VRTSTNETWAPANPGNGIGRGITIEHETATVHLSPVPADGQPAPIAHTPVLLSVEEAARALGIGRTKTFALVGTGELRSVTIGRRRLIPVVALREFEARLSADVTKEAS